MQITCPSCHARYHLDAALEDEAARELMALLAALPREVSRPLVQYLSLFRARTRALSWDRALRLARDTVAQHGDADVLGRALAETVEAMRAKQEQSGWRPLTSHNYLARVLESTTPQAPRPAQGERRGPAGKTAQGLAKLESRRRG